jgi:hypothetical protein
MTGLSPTQFMLLALALGASILAGCQAATVEPAPVATQQTFPTEPATSAVDGTAESQEMTDEDQRGTESANEGDSRANANVEFVRATLAADGTWRFDVTVRHPDTGWEDYADGWDVVTPDGQVLKSDESDPFTRLLLHPHENEQPFTRSQSGIVVPEGVITVIVRAHDLVDGFGGREIEVELGREQGPGFEVIQ